jgi:hypothetical protein
MDPCLFRVMGSKRATVKHYHKKQKEKLEIFHLQSVRLAGSEFIFSCLKSSTKDPGGGGVSLFIS